MLRVLNPMFPPAPCIPALRTSPTAHFARLLDHAENSIVVAEGQLQPSGRFKAVALGMPPPESRAASIEALQARLLWEKEERGLTPCGTLPSNQHTARQAFALLRPASKHHLITPLQGLVTFGGSEPDAKEAAAWDASHPDDATLLLSDVWLDDACAMANLEALLATLAEADASSQPPPSLIVLCGDFLSPAGRRAVVGGGAAKTSAAGGAGGGLMGECRRAFDGLGRLLAQFPAVQVGGGPRNEGMERRTQKTWQAGSHRARHARPPAAKTRQYLALIASTEPAHA